MELNPSPVEAQIGIKFKNPDILQQSLTHRSYAEQANEPDKNNDRLHLLGDVILNFIIADYLYDNCPYLDVTKFTGLQDNLTSGERLTNLWFQLDLGNLYPFLGMKEDRYLLRQRRQNPFHHAFKALVGAIHLDRGFPQVRNWVKKYLIAPLLERHLKKNQKRSTPDKQLKFLGDSLLKAITIDYLYRQLPYVSPVKLTMLSKELVLKNRLTEYIEKITPEDWTVIGLSDKKSFPAILGAMYLHYAGESKDSFRQTSQWFREKFVDDEEVLKRAIALLLKEGKPQKWIIQNVMGYESKRYREGRDRFNELTGIKNFAEFTK